MSLVRVDDISIEFGDNPLLTHADLGIEAEERIGLIGNNGVGKSTPLKILLGMIEPDRGSVKLDTNLETGYFDQLQRELDQLPSLVETLEREIAELQSVVSHAGFYDQPYEQSQTILLTTGGQTVRFG